MTSSVSKVHGARLAVVGALRLVRMLPVIESSGMPLSEDIKVIATTRGRDLEVSLAVETARVWNWVESDPGPVPSVLDIYLISCSVALAVGGVGDMESRTYAIEEDSLEFWRVCDRLVQVANGFGRPEFGGLKTTLAAVEETWRERDWALVRSGRPLAEAFDVQVQRIDETLDKRWSVARGIGRCAGWLNDNDA